MLLPVVPFQLGGPTTLTAREYIRTTLCQKQVVKWGIKEKTALPKIIYCCPTFSASSWGSCSTFACLVFAVPGKKWAFLLHICDHGTSSGRVRASACPVWELSWIPRSCQQLVPTFPLPIFAAQGPAEAPDLNSPQHHFTGVTTPTCLYMLQRAVISKRTFASLFWSYSH